MTTRSKGRCISDSTGQIRKSKSKSKSNPTEEWSPPNWQEVLKRIDEMRLAQFAPVDTMGCHTLADPKVSPQTYRFQVLLSLMLSSQTKDEQTSAAVRRLQEHNCADTAGVTAIAEEELAELIKPVSFYRNKARYIKQTTEILLRDFNGDIPRDYQGLCSLPGVGPKMANLVLLTAFGVVHGISVDTHIHRIANRLHWVRKPTKTPENTRAELESWLPLAHWSTINHTLVGFGQTVCKALRPLCEECSCRELCPFGRSYAKSAKVRVKPKLETLTAKQEVQAQADAKTKKKRSVKPALEPDVKVVETKDDNKPLGRTRRSSAKPLVLDNEKALKPDSDLKPKSDMDQLPVEAVHQAKRKRKHQRIIVDKDTA